MTICYTQTVEDHCALMRFQQKCSAKLQKRQRTSALLMCLSAFLFLIIRLDDLMPMIWAVLLSLLLAIAGGLAWHLGGRHFERLLLQMSCKENHAAVGATELAVAGDGIMERRGNREVKTRWDGIGDIVVDGDRTYIEVHGSSDYIIPHQRLTTGNYALFMQELARQMETHTLAPLKDLTVTAVSVAMPTTLQRTSDTTALQQR